MAIGPVGAVAYANQAMPAQTKIQSNFQNRLDMQNGAAMAMQDADKEEIADVRPTEETYKIDPDHEHEKKRKEEEQKKEKKNSQNKEDGEEEENSSIASPRHLDICV